MHNIKLLRIRMHHIRNAYNNNLDPRIRTTSLYVPTVYRVRLMVWYGYPYNSEYNILLLSVPWPRAE